MIYPYLSLKYFHHFPCLQTYTIHKKMRWEQKRTVHRGQEYSQSIMFQRVISTITLQPYCTFYSFHHFLVYIHQLVWSNLSFYFSCFTRFWKFISHSALICWEEMYFQQSATLQDRVAHHINLVPKRDQILFPIVDPWMGKPSIFSPHSCSVSVWKQAVVEA